MAIIVFLPDIKQALLWWHSVDDVHLCTLFFSEFFILFGGPFPNVNKGFLFLLLLVNMMYFKVLYIIAMDILP